MQITPDQLRVVAADMALELRIAHRLLDQQAAEIEQLRDRVAELEKPAED